MSVRHLNPFDYYWKTLLAYQMACKWPIKNTMEIPFLDKVVINVGFPHITQDKKLILSALLLVELLTQQKAYPTLSKKQVPFLKISKNAFVGAATTLRNKKMITFLNDLVYQVFQQNKNPAEFSFQIVAEEHSITFTFYDPSCFPTLEKTSHFFRHLSEINVTLVFSAKETFWAFESCMLFVVRTLLGESGIVQESPTVEPKK
jgi:large subunit ribosomal protein L5